MDINEIGATAFVISCMRAMEGGEERRLFDDPYAAWFVNDEVEEKVRELIRVYPPSRELVRYRVCAMNEIVEREIAGGARQIVSLGAGFDMRSHVFGAAGARFCDVDQPAVVAFKRKVLEGRGAAPCAAIPCDYLKVDLPDKLAEAGFDLEAPTLFVWEGNTMYLPRDLIHDFLARLRARLPAMTIAFDYFSRKVIDRTSGDEKVTEATDFFESAFGVKWLSGFDDLAVFEERHGLAVAESGSMIDVGRRRAPEAAAGLSQLMELYRYCVLKAS